jgi:hypothetical protein
MDLIRKRAIFLLKFGAKIGVGGFEMFIKVKNLLLGGSLIKPRFLPELNNFLKLGNIQLVFGTIHRFFIGN